ncbi:hypothetical protein MTR67_044804 [Solanum verrucosum]|uniref:Integrase catalytic domain-containing protein n=1 Tax=Solanum verrucosum TaxID=315347 RepID=A0AAF0UU39_SOLVR|nr:hypothetical protein MTR67_044804 [Solanum verrucosum]
MVVNALSRLSMGRIAHVEDNKKELVRDVHRLARMGVQLLDSTKGRLYVPNVDDLRELILSKTHSSRYSNHLGATKMYRDLREVYWWNEMKNDIAEFVAKCPNCQQVKVEHQKLGGLSRDISIPTWKCTNVNMDFVVGLPRNRWLHGVPLSIIFDCGTQFTSQFWKSFQKGLGTRVKLSTTFHPQIDGKAEHTIQTLEEMMRAYVIDFKVLYVSLLKKYVGDPTYIVPLESLGINDSLTYEEVPVQILEQQVRKLRNKEFSSVKVLLRNLVVESATWEAEADMISHYPHLFPSVPTLA